MTSELDRQRDIEAEGQRAAIFHAKQKQPKVDVSEKLKGYGEGIIHGWEAAAAEVAKATNGLFTLNEPREISEWRERIKRYR